MSDRPAGGADAPPAVLVLTGGLVHLVHQLAVLRDLPELLALQVLPVLPVLRELTAQPVLQD